MTWVWTPPVFVVAVILLYVIAQMDLQQEYLVMCPAPRRSVSAAPLKDSLTTIWPCST